MLCQSCNQKEASVHITKIVNGAKTEMHLCEECAKQKHEFSINQPFNFGMPLSLPGILEGFFESLTAAPKPLNQEAVCPVCNKTFNDFRRNGRLGCGNCYSAFSENMAPLIRRIHGNIEHTGKVPKRTGGVLNIRREIDKLKEELKIVVANEEYEKAAKIRDQIRELEIKLNNEGK